MSETKTNTIAFTADEANFVIGLLDQITIQRPRNPDAGPMLALIQSVGTKCDAIVRTSQPLASAAKTTGDAKTSAKAPRANKPARKAVKMRPPRR